MDLNPHSVESLINKAICLERLGNIDEAIITYDSKAGSILNMFDFNTDNKRASNVFLDPSTGISISIRG